jgi:predicted dehydrogenase
MSDWPSVDYGHTPFAAAFTRGDVYAVRPDPARQAKRPLRVAVVGAGGVAQAKWLPAIRRLQTTGEPLHFAGVADTDAGTRDKVAALTGAPAYADTAALLAAERPDLLLVLAADAAHAPAARAAIAHGIPVLVEKPLGRDAAEARALAAEGRAAKVLVAAVANKRFSPPYALAQQLVAQGRLNGAPSVFTGKFTLGYPYVDLLAGGTVHLLDLMRWLMGPVGQLHARAIGHAEAPASVVLSVRFVSGAIGTLMTSATGLSFKPWERVELLGAQALLVVDDQYELTLFDDELGPAKSWRPAIPNTLMFDEEFGGYVGLLAHVADAVRGLVPLSVTADDGAAAVTLIDAIRRSIASGREIDLSREGLAA